MGWFLTKKSTKKKSTRAKSKTKQPWDPDKTLRTMRYAGWVLGAVIVIGGWFYSEGALRDHLGHTQATMPQVRFVDAPQWMPGPVLDGLRATVAATVNPNPFDSDSLNHAAALLERSPWIQRIARVHRMTEGRIEVIAAYRRPIALVESNGTYRLVDVRGVMLPPTYQPDEAAKVGLPMIRGVRQPAPAPGSEWSGGDVRAGMRLGMLVWLQPWKNQVDAIDVSNYGGRVNAGVPHLALIAGGGKVLWGRAPGNEKFYEPPTATKLAYVAEIRRKFNGSIDAGGGQTVDLSGDSIRIWPSAQAADVRYTLSQ